MINILVPTDFSKNAWNAIEYALEYFKDSSCNFYLLHVTTISNYAGGETPLIPTADVIEKSLLKQAKVDLQKILIKIKKMPF